MKLKTFLVVAAASILASCSSKDNAVIELNVAGAADKEIILSKLQVNRVDVLDTLKLDGQGGTKCKVEVREENPDFYYLSYNRKRLASLLLKGGDKVEVSVDTLGQNLIIKGSEESVKLAEVERKIYDATVEFDSLSVELVNAVEANDAEKMAQLQMEVSKFFVKYKRSVLAHIMKDPGSLSNITLLYQKFTDDLTVFGDVHDVVYFRKVYDSLKVVYPKSIYVNSLKEEVERYQKAFEFNNKMTLAGEQAYPEIALPDINGQTRKMSELLGKPFVLFFWTSSLDQQKMYNHDLKELYAKYHPKGLEIYQVSADVDKTQWATVVKEQELPWINVCDGLGTSSIVLHTYSVAQLPTMYIFDKDGNIVAKNIFDKRELDRELGKLSY